ncbi:LysR family transcriptional regulator [Streptomyces sp. NPDC049577]|uniref:LysR family transcriptional regulator n=1 Tax=Streptomyces sp. NPDC049577 TaxID=3155153 RepID=UPI00341B4D58
MDLRAIETFLVLSEELHFGRAASRLCVTQGRVSQTIRALETEVGAQLFERTSRRVRLTALGERFHAGARRGHDELVRTLRECRAVARGMAGRLRIGYLPSVGGAFLSRIATDFAARHPHCDVVLNALVCRGGPNPGPLLREGEVDMALVWSPGGDGQAVRDADMTVGPTIAAESRGVVVPAGHPLHHRPAVTLDDLVDYELIGPPETAGPGERDLWTPRYTPSGRRLRHTPDGLTQMTGRSQVLADDVLTLVARGRGLHLGVVSLLDHIPFPGLAVVPVVDMPPMVVVPVWPTAAETPAVRAFAHVAAGTPRPAGGLALSPRGVG